MQNSAVKAVQGQYEWVLSSLEEMAKSTSKTASTASGLFEHFCKGKTVLGLTLASAVVGELECLNSSLQKKTHTVSGMQAVVEHVRSALPGKRNEKSYMALYEKATTLIDSIDSTDSIEVAHSRRFAGKAMDHYRVKFFKVLDCVEAQFSERFDQESLKILQKVESSLLTGQFNDALAQYPELNRASL